MWGMLSIREAIRLVERDGWYHVRTQRAIANSVILRNPEQ